MMKKVLLSTLVAMTVASVQAQNWTGAATWSKSLTPVTEAKQLSGTHTAVADDGSVFTTGTYNQKTAFGTTPLTNLDQLTSAYIAKYNADGSEAWAVGLYGRAVINSVDTDADGNVFVAGRLADEVEFYSVGGSKQTVQGEKDATVPTATFVAKYNKNGVLKAVRTILPVASTTVTGSGLYYPEAGDIRFVPVKLQVSGDKVYLAGNYTGNVKIDNVNWEGRYVNVFEVMYMDVASVGIMAMNTADLTGATSVATLMAKENLISAQHNPESVCFTVDGSTVYAGFVGKGTETLTTAGGNTEITMKTSSDESGNIEHALILAKIDGNTTTHKVFHVDMHDKSYGTDIVGAMEVQGGNLYVGGTFYNKLGFDTSKTSTGSADIFVANLNPSDFSVNWAAIDAYDEGAVSENEESFRDMVVNNGKVFIAGVDRTKDGVLNHALTYNITSDGTLTTGNNVAYASLDDNGKGRTAAVVNNETQTTVSVYASPTTGIGRPGTVSATAEHKVYTISGQAVGSLSALPKGIYIVGNKKVVVK